MYCYYVDFIDVGIQRITRMKIRIKQAAGRLWKDIRQYKWLGVFLLIYYLLMEHIFSAFCPSVIITGFPCPGCGMTRAFLFVLTGQFERAWNINPLIYGCFLFALYAGVQRYLLGERVKGWKVIMMILAAAMIGFYIYRMYRYFPDKPPMTFNRGSLFERLVPGYGKVIRAFIY